MGGWSCPHEIDGVCQRLRGRPCRPGQPGCLLYGRFRFYTGDADSDAPADDDPGDDPRPVSGG